MRETPNSIFEESGSALAGVLEEPEILGGAMGELSLGGPFSIVKIDTLARNLAFRRDETHVGGRKYRFLQWK